MEILLTVAKAILILFAIAGIAHTCITERRNYKFVWQIWKRFRIRMFFEVLGVLLLIFAVAIVLWIGVPGLKYGWLNPFFEGGGNILIRPIQEGSESTSVLVRLLVPLFFLAFMFVMPFLARIEENSFRKGHEEWSSILKQSVKFGLIHLVVGVPLAIGIALIILGFFLGYKYKRAFDRNRETFTYWQAQDEAVMVSTVYHTIYNMVILIIVLLAALAAVWK